MRLALVVLPVSLTACAVSPIASLIIAGVSAAADGRGEFSVESLDAATNIGVVSVLPNEIGLIYIKPPGFSNRRNREDVPHWQLNPFASSIAVRNLSVLGSYTAGILRVTGGGPAQTSLSQSDLPPFGAAENQGFDSVIVIRGVCGLEVQDPTFLLNTVSRRCAYSNVAVEFWDVKTHELRGRIHSYTCDHNEEIEVRDSLAEYSLAEQQWIETLVKKSLAQSINHAMRKLEIY